MQINFFDSIRRTLLQQPEQVFIVWPGAQGTPPATYTGRAILNRIAAIRRALAAAVAPGQAVLLALPVSPDLIFALLAVMAQGAVPVLPPAAATPGALLRVVRRTRVRAVLVPQPLRPVPRLVAQLCRVRMVVVADLAAADPTTIEAAVPVPAAQWALVSHSSGSTGQPKAIRRSHQVLQAQHEAIKAVFPPWAGQRDFPLFPNILLHNLAAGVVSILPNVPWGRPQVPDPARVVAQLARERVHTLTGNVAYFAALVAYLRLHPVALPHVVAVGIGGSPVPEPLVQALRQVLPGAAVHIIYGSSEAEPIAVRTATAAAPTPLAGYCVGALHPALEWRIRPLGTLRRGPGAGQVVGEILVRGVHVATPVPGEWLPTGDFGYVLNNQLFLTGRQGNERLHQGVQHYQLEHLLYHLPGVERVAARADAAGFSVFIQGSVSRAAVEELLCKNFHQPIWQAIHFRPHLPVDARHHSKILYAQLR